MRVEVDEARCEGHGLCEAAAPELITLDDEGIARVSLTEIPVELRRQAEAGVRACPVAALRLTEGRLTEGELTR